MPSRNPTWRVQMSSSRGLPYFYSPTLGISSWDVPSELSAEDVQKLPGAMLLKGMDEPKIHYLSGAQSLEDLARVSHILFKHTQSRNPNKKRSTEQRTCSEALSLAKKYIKELNGSGAAFAKLAKEVSDCSSYARGGDMGWFTYGQLQNDFEKEAFKLKIGEISAAPIETTSGVHLILKTGGVVKPAVTERHNGEMTSSPAATTPLAVTKHIAEADGGVTPKGGSGGKFSSTDVAAGPGAVGEKVAGDAGKPGKMTSSQVTTPSAVAKHIAEGDGGATPKGGSVGKLTSTDAAAGAGVVGEKVMGDAGRPSRSPTGSVRVRKDSYKNGTSSSAARTRTAVSTASPKLANSPRRNGST